jgi:EAL domain-containing protein (putative c-di-GMP-specific phosphodiesterase class I)/CheY-like chemotaxis protein
MTTSQDLYNAITDETLQLYLQPLIDVRSGRVVQFEALSRWTDLDEGEIPPAIFIPMAEKSSLITPLTLLQLRRAVDSLGWMATARPDIGIAINVALETLQWPGFVPAVEAALRNGSGSPSSIAVEITESTLMTDPETVQRTLGALRRLGIRIYLDDFGTGFSSLKVLSELPLDALKVDRSFTSSMTTEPRLEAIVRATISLGHDFNLEVVAEGVEDRATWELLLAMGCDTAQGFHIARPMPVADVPGWLDSWETGLQSIRVVGMQRALQPSPGATTVLIADDEPTILAVMKSGLEGAGFGVVTAANGIDAVRIAEQIRPAAVILDMNMPKLDGAGVIAALRARDVRASVAIMTAGASAERWARELGADSFLEKPFDLARLIAVTRKLVRTEQKPLSAA